MNPLNHFIREFTAWMDSMAGFRVTDWQIASFIVLAGLIMIVSGMKGRNK